MDFKEVVETSVLIFSFITYVKVDSSTQSFRTYPARAGSPLYGLDVWFHEETMFDCTMK